MIYSTSRTQCTTWWDFSSVLATAAAAMAGRRCGSTVRRQWKLWRLSQTLRRASQSYGEPSASTSVARGGRWRRGHDDGARGDAPARLCTARWLTKLEQRALGDAGSRWEGGDAVAVANGRLSASLSWLWRRRRRGDLGCRCGEEGGGKMRK